MRSKMFHALIGSIALVVIAALLLIPRQVAATDDQRGPLVPDWPPQGGANPATGTIAGLDWLDTGADGQADVLAVGREFAASLVLRTNQSAPTQPLAITSVFNSGNSVLTGDAAWSQVFSDQALLAVPASSDGITIYQLDTINTTVSEVWSANSTVINASRVAWGDFNADGLPDLVSNNLDTSAALHLNELNLTPPALTNSGWTPNDISSVTAVAVGDVAGDTSPDILLADPNQGIVIYTGNQVTPPYVAAAPATTLPNFGVVAAMELGDLTGDNKPEVVIGTDSGLNIFTSENNLDLGYASSDRNKVVSIALEDYDNDGDLDIAYGTQIDLTDNSGTVVLLRNDTTNRILHFTQVWSTSGAIARDLAWGDADGDNAPELAVGRINDGLRVYRNIGLIDLKVRVSFDGANRPDAQIFRRPSGAIGPLMPVTGPDGRPILTNQNGELSTRGTVGLEDEIVAIWPATPPLERTSTTTVTIDSGAPNTITSTITISGAGVIQDLAVPEIIGSHTWFGDLRITLISPAGTEAVLVQGVCDGQLGFNLGFTDNATETEVTCPPNSGQIVTPVDPLAIFKGEAANGTWTLRIEDRYFYDGGELTRWKLRLRAPNYPLYYTNLPIGTDGFTFERVGSLLEPISLAVSEQNPLVIFDLEVSLEWDARKDTAFMSQLYDDLERTAALLYDWTDGQVTLGNITINHDRLRWAEADVRIYASNRVRPNADKGGIVPNPIAEKLPDGSFSGFIFRPGQVRMGSVWNRYGEAQGIAGEDWPRALAHELGHYLLFLDDNYIGFATRGDREILVPVPEDELDNNPFSGYCVGAMNNPYREDESEFHPGGIDTPDSTWFLNCGNTLSQRYSSRSDWQAITNYYPQLKAPTAFNGNSGPNYLPLNIVRFNERAPTTAADTVSQQIFSLVEQTESGPQRLQPGDTARAYIFKDYNDFGGTSRLIELGRPTTDQLTVRGLSPGDRLCFYEPEKERLGCDDTISDTDTSLSVSRILGWNPDVRLSPVDKRTIRVEIPLESLGPNVLESLEVQLFPGDQAPSSVVTLTLQNGVFSGTVSLSDPNAKIDQAMVVVREPDLASPRLEAIVDYTLYGVPVETPSKELLAASGGRLAQSSGCSRPKCAPASLDGHATIYTVGPDPGLLYSFQTAGELPAPPAWAVPVGLGYWVRTADGTNTAIGEASINVGYSDTDLPEGSEGGLGIYYWDETGFGEGTWQRLTSTRVDSVRNELTANAAGPGLYVLMTSLTPRNGWNLLSYAWSGEEPLEALAELNATAGEQYETIYGYEDGDGWNVYAHGIASPFAEIVNTLDALVYGRGYWVYVLDNGTTVAATVAGAELAASIPLPPATFYGVVPAEEGFSPTAGLTVEARINGNLCGSSKTVTLSDNRIGYRINVDADQPGASGCGVAGRSVALQVSGQSEATYTTWSSDRPLQVDLTGLGKLYLPFIVR